METTFKFKLGDIVIVNWRNMPKCRIIERFYEYNDRLYFGGGAGVPIENRCYNENERPLYKNTAQNKRKAQKKRDKRRKRGKIRR